MSLTAFGTVSAAIDRHLQLVRQRAVLDGTAGAGGIDPELDE